MGHLKDLIENTMYIYIYCNVLVHGIQVANQSDTKSRAAFSLAVATLCVEVACSERVDHTWVALAYGKSL